ncbi:MAG TPA: hypothetical protein VGP82_07130 [Ktedonobacterales bacterium]|jgi:hypothetical protein|nr:hypothetical protein [Ktedonobacterales bacterium]
MTQAQRSELDRAIDRATAHGIEVVAKGHRKQDNTRIYCTTSNSEQDRWHVVTVLGTRLMCDCKSHVICAHRGAVHMHLVVAAVQREDFAERVRQAAEHETSGRRGPAAFSLMK